MIDNDGNKQDSLWKEFNACLDMYKFYIDAILKVGIFSFTVTGAIVSYYLAHSKEEQLLYLSLFLPLLVNAGFLYIFMSSIDSAEKLREDHIRIEGLLGLDSPFEMTFLTNLVKLFSWFYGIISICLVLLFLSGFIKS